MRRVLCFVLCLIVVVFVIKHCSSDKDMQNDKSVIFVTPIAEVLDNPQEHVGKTVAIKGCVSMSNGLFNHCFFTLTDSTGDILVISSDVAPENGQVVRVEGSLVQTFRFGDVCASYFKADNYK